MRIIRIIALICAMLMLFPILPAHADDPYWAIREEYLKAVESGDSMRIINVVKMAEALYPDLATEEQRSRIMFMIKNAANQYEKLGMFSEAAKYYQKFLDIVQKSVNEGYTTYSAYLRTIPKMVAHNSVNPRVYAVTSTASNIPYFKAKNEPVAGTNVGMCDSFNVSRDSAFLLYIVFGDQNISDFDWMIPKDNPNVVLTVAWNMKHETLDDLKEINSGKFNDYIERNLEYLNTLKCKVMIRFGTEVNCWSSLPSTEEAYKASGEEFKTAFINAFRLVAKRARKTAPEAAMVYSPNEISGWYFDHTDFYPGDEYVDWVGMSTYGNALTAAGVLSDENDSFYCRGYYENQITRIKSIVDTYGNRKPIMISEMGFCYSSADGLQSTAHAKEAMRFFLTYVNMVYPQIKLINYFNTNYGTNKYKIFKNTFLSDGQSFNSELGSLYASLMKNNPAAAYSLGHSDKC